MIVYTLTDGKIKTPFYVMTGQSVYCRCCSQTSLNKIGISISYDDVRRGLALLASYAIKKSQDNLHLSRVTFGESPGPGTSRAFAPYMPYAPSCLHALHAFVSYLPSHLTCLDFYAP